MGAHALGVHDVVLLLQRHLRKAGTARPGHCAERGARGSADPGTTPAADGTAERRSERRGENGPSHRLVIGRIHPRRGLRRGILLAGRLIGREGVEALVRPRRDGDRRPQWRRDARRQRNRPGHHGHYTPIDTRHVPSLSLKRQPILRRVFLCRQAVSDPSMEMRQQGRVYKASFATSPRKAGGGPGEKSSCDPARPRNSCRPSERRSPR